MLLVGCRLESSLNSVPFQQQPGGNKLGHQTATYAKTLFAVAADLIPWRRALHCPMDQGEVQVLSGGATMKVCLCGGAEDGLYVVMRSGRVVLRLR